MLLRPLRGQAFLRTCFLSLHESAGDHAVGQRGAYHVLTELRQAQTPVLLNISVRVVNLGEHQAGTTGVDFVILWFLVRWIGRKEILLMMVTASVGKCPGRIFSVERHCLTWGLPEMIPVGPVRDMWTGFGK